MNVNNFVILLDFFFYDNMFSLYLTFLCPRRMHFLDSSFFLTCLVFSKYSSDFTTFYKLASYSFFNFLLNSKKISSRRTLVNARTFWKSWVINKMYISSTTFNMFINFSVFRSPKSFAKTFYIQLKILNSTLFNSATKSILFKKCNTSFIVFIYI